MLAAGFLMTAAGANAQNAYDALNLAKTDPIMGTARYSAMGGALGALGADATVLKDNPAGLGVYRSCDLTLTPNVYVTDDKSVGFNINNFAFVLNFGKSGHKKGYVTSSLGVSYNRLRNFKRYYTFRENGWNHSMTEDFFNLATDEVFGAGKDLGLIDAQEENGKDVSATSQFRLKDEYVDRRIKFKEDGALDEWNISYGMNISNRFYWGVGVGFVNIDYTQTSSYDEYGLNGQGDWYKDEYYEAKGTGFNFKFGAIGRLTDFMRVGVAFHTPTFYNVDQYTNTNMDYKNQSYNTEIDWSETEYDLQTPLKLQGSLGFIIGKRALVGLEYQYEDYGAMRLSDGFFDSDEEKDIINEYMKKTHTFKVGTEVAIVNGFSGRLGFAYVTKPVDEALSEVYNTTYSVALPREAMYYTGGLGYKGKSFYADFALVFKNQKEYFFDYLPIAEPISKESLFSTNIMATVGWRF